MRLRWRLNVTLRLWRKLDIPLRLRRILKIPLRLWRRLNTSVRRRLWSKVTGNVPRIIRLLIFLIELLLIAYAVGLLIFYNSD
jgi:hypothetical protein